MSTSLSRAARSHFLWRRARRFRWGLASLGLLLPLSWMASPAGAQELDPAIYVLVDTSGSMLMTPDGTQNTYGDGSVEHPGVAGLTSRLYMAKEALRTVINAYGEVRWGLARFQQSSGRNRLCMCHDEIPNNVSGCGGYGGLWAPEDDCRLCDMMSDYPDYDEPGTHDRVCINYSGGVLAGCTDPIDGAPLVGADILVPVGASTEAQILRWIDHSESDPGEPGYNAGLPPEQQPDPELRAVGGTPIGGSLADLYDQLSQTDLGNDPLRGCRPYSVIVLTDGAESCDSDPVTWASMLLQVPDLQHGCGSGCPPNATCQAGHCVYQVPTYVIAFAVAPNEFLNCNDIAQAGGTGGAIPASNDAELVAAMAEIIADSIRTELCNGTDDDCDGAVDEDFPDLGTACDNGALGQCYCAGVKQCAAGGQGTECAYNPANAANPCGQVDYGAEASFGCDGLDNDCDGLVDEGLNCSTPPPELCDGLDNDSDPTTPDGADDPAVGQPCGSSIGQCTPGTTVCQGGAIVCQGGTGPTTETCNGYDDNCDGVVDGLTQSCYSPGSGNGCTYSGGTWTCQGQCSPGIQLCPALSAPDPTNTWGPCQGETVPSVEICDGVDNDCDGQVDEGLTEACYPPGSGPETGCQLSGGNWICQGLCQVGSRTCNAGTWTQCTGQVTPTIEVCDGQDNDCNGLVDDDIPGLGQPCSNALGRCTPGTLQCQNGVEVCVGGEGPFPGECNGLDDDCDGAIDEPDEVSALEGLPCGDATGVCTPGTTLCLGGQIVCTGGVAPSGELCDGLDNDCDGQVDDNAECPPDWYCVAADCRQECDPTEEFPCPGGLFCKPYVVDGTERYLCLPNEEICGSTTCPEGYVCVDDECVDPCEGVSCEPWETCRNGYCLDESCTGVGGACADGERCNPASHACEPDPCARCAPDEACVDGQCVADPCATAPCDPIWEYCRRDCTGGSCTASCDAICVCQQGEVCDAAGQCVADPCAGACVSGEVCDGGLCVDDPCLTVACAPAEVCVGGVCVDDPCDQVACPAHAECAVHATGDGTQVAAICEPAPGRWVPEGDGETLTSLGGGGTGCNAAGGSGGVLLGLLGFLWLGWRRRRTGAGGRTLRRLGALLALGLAAGGGTGCRLSTYETGSGGHWQYLDGGHTDGFVVSDGSVDASPDACVPTPEQCDGLDNDCDGVVDNGFDLNADPNNCGACGTVCDFPFAIAICLDASCIIDTSQGNGGCFPGHWDIDGDPSNGCEYACQITSGGTEICDNLDNDCNGVVDDGFDLDSDPLNCGACGFPCVFFNGVGSCVAGHCTLSGCDPGYVDADGNPNNGCECMITNPTDVCDGVDSDCDGLVDEDAPVGAACYTHPTGCTENPPGSGNYTCVGQCATGNLGCVGGVTQCTGQQGPVGEICNGLDDDCDGQVDNGFDLQSDIVNCGSCGNSCIAATPPNAYTTGCSGGQCGFACLPGHHDLNGDLQNPTNDGCEYACQQTAPNGTEYCDGQDNDCDGLVDEAGDLVPPPGNLCKEQTGTPCTNVGTVCTTGVLGTTWYCQYPAGVETDPANPNQVLANETLCDGFDGNCDGNVDESFTPLPGTPCDDGQLGACRGTGTYQCNAAQDDVQCTITNPGATPAQEVCDEVDNDCDGLVDEPITQPGSNPSYVQDDVVTVSVGGESVRVFQYEASRPSATGSSQGSGSDTRACSRPGVLPWSRVTYEQARQACQRAGMTLCGDLEWTEACDGQGTAYSYPYGNSYSGTTCNGEDAGNGAAVATGAMGSCTSAGYGIYDLSGNLREWTSEVIAYTDSGKAIYGVRGGAYTDLSGGLRCDFRSSGLVEDAFSANVGFRCCSRCGNGVVDPGEQCDDGNLVNGDGCSAVCGPDTCGDGVVQGAEACDCGTNPASLPAGCTDVNGGPKANCAVNCTVPAERCSSLYPEDQDRGGEANDCADPDCASTWCADVTDNDGDGFSEADGDCNDSDPNVSPAADEVCGNGVDDNCNGFVDDAEPDKDGDGELRCVGGSQNDCDDWNAEASPARIEICGDGIDNDCDGLVDQNCATPCEIAAFNRSYIGCEYFAASTMNSQLGWQPGGIFVHNFENNFALVIHNPSVTTSANVTIAKAGSTVQTAVLAPGQLQVFTLAYDLTLKNSNSAPILVTGGAYHITSDMPISVYQFNPFDFRLGGWNSYTNDASLVLPKSVLTRNYMVTNRQTWEIYGSLSLPGFLAIIGTENGTTVQITYNGHVRGGVNRGQSETVTLNAGDVYQVPSRGCGCSPTSGCYCSTDYDFTGTRIQVTNPAGHPVAVIGGHDCTFIPADTWACDHLEEMMFPLETWGKRYVATITDHAPINWFRVVSSVDGNTVTFTPAAVHAPANLNAGEYVEFQATQHFSVECTEPCAVTEFILADELFAVDSDPAMALLVPTEQFRKDYAFTVPSSMTYNYVSVIKPVAQPGLNSPTVYLDGVAIPESNFSQAIGNSYFGVARLDISSAPYSHTITSDQPFGIMVYGFASYTSYFYPGGLDLNLINAVN